MKNIFTSRYICCVSLDQNEGQKDPMYTYTEMVSMYLCFAYNIAHNIYLIQKSFRDRLMKTDEVIEKMGTLISWR